MFGSHLSIAGGMHHALLAAEALQCDTVQVFTKNQQQWKAPPLDAGAVARFRQEAQRLGFVDIVAHDSYLINLAAANEELREKSIAAFSHEMARCDELGIRYLVTHPGAHTGQGEEVGMARVIDAFRRIMKEHKKGRVIVCLETTAGQGSVLGYTFEQIAAMLAGIGHASRFGVCMDTCHIFAAGYDISTPAKTRAVLKKFDAVIGLDRLRVLHLNDSKKPLGSRVDRHEHIGRGMIGLAAFEVICRDKRLAGVPKILETPKEGTSPEGVPWDEANLSLLRSLAGRKKNA